MSYQERSFEEARRLAGREASVAAVRGRRRFVAALIILAIDARRSPPAGTVSRPQPRSSVVVITVPPASRELPWAVSPPDDSASEKWFRTRETDLATLDFVSLRPASHWAVLPAEDVRRMHEHGEIFVDGRDESDFLQAHVAGARSFPASGPSLSAQVRELAQRDSEIYAPIIVYGAGEGRQIVGLAESLYEAGFLNVLLSPIGFRDLAARGVPIRRGPEAPSAEVGSNGRASTGVLRSLAAAGGPSPRLAR